jgi:hypothetical protein
VLDVAGGRTAARRTVRRPADLGDDDVLVLQIRRLLELADLVLEVFERRLARLLVPVGQDVDGDVVDFLGELGIVQPDVPRLGGADRHLDVALDVPDLADELSRAGGVGVAQVLLGIPAQDVLVADQHALDIGVLVGHADQRASLLGIDLRGIAAELLLGFVGAVDPGARHQLQADARGELGHVLAAVGGAVRPHVLDLAGEHGEVALDLFLARLDRRRQFFSESGTQEGKHAARLGLERVLVLGPRRIGDAVQRALDVGGRQLAIEQAPSGDGGRRRYNQNQRKSEHGLVDRSGWPPAVNARIRDRARMSPADDDRRRKDCAGSTHPNEPTTTQCGGPLGGFLAPDFLVCDPSQAMRRPARSIACGPGYGKESRRNKAKMSKSDLHD